MMSSNKIDNIGNYVLPVFYNVLNHPFTHARTLMQLGYEPAPAYMGHSVLSAIGYGKKVEKYPSIFTYCKYMRKEVGLVGIFTIGLTSRVLYWSISEITTDMILTRLNEEKNPIESQVLNADTDLYEYISEVRNLTIARSVALVVAYPFHVLMVRQMAEIMNTGAKESKFLFSLFTSILDDEGILGLYGGLKAKLIGEVLTIWLTAGFVYAFNKYVLDDRVANDIKTYSPNIGGMLVKIATYRFTVLSTVMAIAGSKITGAVPLLSMWECYTQLSNKKAFNRGSSLIMRYVK